jgi:hypothetical protein
MSDWILRAQSAIETSKRFSVRRQAIGIVKDIVQHCSSCETYNEEAVQELSVGSSLGLRLGPARRPIEGDRKSFDSFLQEDYASSMQDSIL